MKTHKLIVATCIAFLGATLVFLLGKVLSGLVGSTIDIISCILGSFVSTYFLVQPGLYKLRENLLIAAGIVFITFLFISVGNAAEQIIIQRVSVDFEPTGKFIWATLVVSWWAIPVTAYILGVLNYKLKK